MEQAAKEAQAAVVLQAAQRGRMARRQATVLRRKRDEAAAAAARENHAAVVLQAAQRGRLARKQASELRRQASEARRCKAEAEAAVKVGVAWVGLCFLSNALIFPPDPSSVPRAQGPAGVRFGQGRS